MEELRKESLTAIRCQDIQTGLQGFDIAEFKTLAKTGMAARLAIHLRGGDAIRLDALQEISHPLFGIGAIEFESVVQMLQEIEFVEIHGKGESRLVRPKVPFFNDMYSRLGTKALLDGLNEHERASVDLLDLVATQPCSRYDAEKQISIEEPAFSRVLSLADAGSYVSESKSPDGSILVSPLYWGEKPDRVAAAVRKLGASETSNVFKWVREAPGTPLAVINATGMIGTRVLSDDEKHVLRALVDRGIVQVPSITTTYSGENNFVFTPRIGTQQIQVVEKEVYEKAMAAVACLRQGQFFGSWRIGRPLAIIEALLERGYVGENTVAKEQYRWLVIRKICCLVPPNQKWQRLTLIDTPENRRALALAAEMLTSAEIVEARGLDQQTKMAIQEPKYHESLRAYGEIRKKRRVPITDAEAARQAERLITLIQLGA
jgi:hypothetical protein